MTKNRVIGNHNQLPWHLPADLRYFKALTLGKPILMGRQTYASIGRLLPGRQNLILTKNKAFQLPGAWVVHSWEEALKTVPAAQELLIIGGAAVFQALLPKIQRIYITLVHTELPGDRYFPELDLSEWRQLSREDHLADKENCYPYSFLVWERVED